MGVFVLQNTSEFRNSFWP